VYRISEFRQLRVATNELASSGGEDVFCICLNAWFVSETVQTNMHGLKMLTDCLNVSLCNKAIGKTIDKKNATMLCLGMETQTNDASLP